MLGNASASFSAEMRRAALYRIDARLNDMDDKELGPAAAGMLFGAPFITELHKLAATFTTLKVENFLKRVFKPSSVFG